ncbi:D-alanyl-D-alanine carboxypeptidase/D-alanyl-D-alanine-endopeptidase [Actinoplanes sp. NPDC023714]|uniref:D-alanyl-D-alanine carboxypeptidase/D-alanyl-D-alanine endopeptidase n=1 Tax=Actinoplanes sp. NPDC023714 TaxID=3154322 RepID=UPI0033E58165
MQPGAEPDSGPSKESTEYPPSGPGPVGPWNAPRNPWSAGPPRATDAATQQHAAVPPAPTTPKAAPPKAAPQSPVPPANDVTAQFPGVRSPGSASIPAKPAAASAAAAVPAAPARDGDPWGQPGDATAQIPKIPPAAPQPPITPPGDGVPEIKPTSGGSYGRASVPLNTTRPTSPAPAGPAAGTGAAAPADDAPRPEEVKTGRKKRTKMVSVLAAVVLLALVAAVGLVVRPGPVDGWLGAESESTPSAPPRSPDPTPTPVLAAAETDGATPDTAAVQAALDPLVNSSALGSTVHVSVLDPVTSTVLYAKNADVPTTPASTTKLLTAATALAARGPAYRLATRVVAGENPGEVVIVGAGDPTMSVDGNQLFPGAARLDKLAEQVKKALGDTPATRVYVDMSLYEGPETATGWGSSDIGDGQVARIQPFMTNGGRIDPVHNEFGGDPRYSNPANAAGKLFAGAIGVSAAVRAGKAPEPAAGAASAAPDASAPAAGAWTPGKELGKVESPPLVQIVDWMLQQSDNVLAEAVARQVALAAGKPASFEGASEAMLAKLEELGLPSDEANLYDGSGLSRNNGISPTLLVRTLALAANGSDAKLSALFNGLPVAGWSGTLRTRFVTPSPNQEAQGIVRAKTGTLSGVNTLAGVLVNKDGRVMVFAIMAVGGASAISARAALDKVAARLVECGC